MKHELTLSPEKSRLLERLRELPEGMVIKEIFDFYIKQLENVRNIDDKGNMGLQSLANQKAVLMLDEIQDMIFPTGTGVPQPRAPVPGESSLPPYR